MEDGGEDKLNLSTELKHMKLATTYTQDGPSKSNGGEELELEFILINQS